MDAVKTLFRLAFPTRIAACAFFTRARGVVTLLGDPDAAVDVHWARSALDILTLAESLGGRVVAS